MTGFPSDALSSSATPPLAMTATIKPVHKKTSICDLNALLENINFFGMPLFPKINRNHKDTSSVTQASSLRLNTDQPDSVTQAASSKIETGSEEKTHDCAMQTLNPCLKTEEAFPECYPEKGLNCPLVDENDWAEWYVELLPAANQVQNYAAAKERRQAYPKIEYVVWKSNDSSTPGQYGVWQQSKPRPEKMTAAEFNVFFEKNNPNHWLVKSRH